MMAEFVEIFYDGALIDRGYSVRLDLLMIYDLDALEPVGALPLEECCEYSFMDLTDKRNALLGIIKIL
jgi:hypothetical protein